MTRTRTILALLEQALELAHEVIIDGPLLDDILATDLCSLLAATGGLLRRYQKVIRALELDTPF